MRQFGLCLAVMMGFAAFGCAPMMEVRQVYDDVDFSAYKTYAWVPRPEGDTAKMADRQKYLEDAFSKTIEQQMAAKGFTKVPENPDVLVGFLYGMANPETGVVDFEVDYNQYYTNREVWESGGGAVRIDFIDPKTNKIVWCGTASGAVNVDPSQEIVEKNVDRAVTKILAQYPPRKAAK